MKSLYDNNNCYLITSFRFLNNIIKTIKVYVLYIELYRKACYIIPIYITCPRKKITKTKENYVQ